MNIRFAAVLSALFAASPLLAQSTDAEFHALGRAHKVAELEALARQRLAENPQDEVALWHLARAVAQDPRQRDELIAHAERCTRELPKSARCHNALGSLLGARASAAGMAEGIKLAGRIKALHVTAAELDPRHFASRRDLNQFYLFAPGIVGGSVRKALQGCKDYAAFDAARAKVLRADVHSYEEEFDEAESLLTSITPGNDAELANAVRDATSSLGLALINEGEAGRAEKLFERQLAADAGYAEAHFGLGRALLEQSKLDGAIAALQRALQLDSRIRAHYRLGIAYQQKGDAGTALMMLRQFLSYSPEGRAADDARKRVAALSGAQR
jgi:tetratricopeptide (TPR) repeat protein